ncbi:hypothetical protein [Porphyromonas asaccharolytica]|uniref:hypothetical protein n=1 Tax=Porphyromonas asaccharolytica TaxID=28123 RepID=UPI00248E20DF|nr:hypothetical protein [Porphyromonas asaccharolytica]
MQYYLRASLRGGLLAGLLLLCATNRLEATPLATLAPDTIIERDDYKVIIESSKDQTDVTLVDYNERHRVRRMETNAFSVDRELRQVLAGMGGVFGLYDDNSFRWGTIRLFPKLYFGSTMMLGDAFAHAATPCFNHYMVAPIGYRYYIKGRYFVGFDFALEGRSYSLRDGYYFTSDKELSALNQDHYDEEIGLRQSKLVTRYISLPITLGMRPMMSSRMRIGIEVIPQIKYKEYVMHKQYGNRHKERTMTEATPPLSMTYGAFIDFRPIGLYVHYTPQSLLLVKDAMSGYNNKGLLTAGLSITF